MTLAQPSSGATANVLSDQCSTPGESMSVRRFIIAAASLLTFAGAAHASELRPLEGRSLDLGSVSGVAYYKVEENGFRIFATLAQGEAGTPVRFVALLAPGQSVTLSSAGEEGSAPASVEFTRQQHQMFVREAVTSN